MRLEKSRVKYDLRKSTFLIGWWILLGTVCLTGLCLNATNTFKARLDKFWHNQDTIYNFRAQLQGTGSRSECLYEES